MSIEELFSKIKLVLKCSEDILQEMDMETALLAAFCTVTPDDCKTGSLMQVMSNIKHILARTCQSYCRIYFKSDQSNLHHTADDITT